LAPGRGLVAEGFPVVRERRTKPAAVGLGRGSGGHHRAAGIEVRRRKRSSRGQKGCTGDACGEPGIKVPSGAGSVDTTSGVEAMSLWAEGAVDGPALECPIVVMWVELGALRLSMERLF